MAIGKYISKEIVKDFYAISNINKIKDAHIQYAENWVDSGIRILGFDHTKYDSTDPDLYTAALLIIGELLSKLKVITWTCGQIEEERIGLISRRFPRWQPMFFFATGVAKGFYNLLPHQTWLMEAREYIERFAQSNQRDRVFVPAICKKDTSYRGYGWDYEPQSRTEIRDL
ncbi:unnamed protein product [marine sediment metagenome]|uniref:Uncharacterized protein n=1 Tax=marine sediment metagenome TaxID=412755 RepID=X0U7D5_9ZZZZ